MTADNEADRYGTRFRNAMWATAALTVPMVALIASPYWLPRSDGSAVLYALYGFNGLSLIAYPLIYLGALTLYASRLRSLLGRIPEKDRAIPRNALWLVVAAPFNFVGSFFVIVGTARSLALDERISSHVQRWRYLGIAWCSFQVLAFFPNMTVSFIALLTSYVLWAAHWVYSVRLDERLASPEEAVSRE